MPETKSGALRKRAWSFIRLALLWARKGGVLRRRFLTELRSLPGFLRNGSAGRRGARFGERELSFDDTPVFHVRMSRPPAARFPFLPIPCLNPQADFDYDFGAEDGSEIYGSLAEEERIRSGRGEENIDLMADEFIARFREQMRLQRQISNLQYKEILN